jgi:Fe-S oxidoreductase
MIDNLRMRKSVFPISTKSATKWAKGLDIPRGGETVIYTGHMYQLLPYINASVKNLERFEDSFLGKFIFLARFFNKIFNISKLMAIPSRADVSEYNQIIRNIALLLKQAGIEFGYLYEAELYTGALAYDMGVDDSFKEHARKVYSMLKENGVENLITVDPHTTNMLRSVYPTFIDGYDIHVKSYLEVLVEKDMKPVNEADADIVIHDSCIYARYEDVIEEPRKLLKQAGYKVKEPKDSKDLTHCCGGPVESIFPKTANQIGEKRVEQLINAKAQSAALMCPICLATLKKAAGFDIKISDVSTLLAKVYCDGQFS